MTIIDFVPIVVFFIFLLLGMPVAFSLAITGVIGIATVLGIPATLGALATIPFRTTASFTIVSIAMFILMAEIATASGITSRLFAAANSLVGHLRGGLGIATVIAGAAFGTLSGSSIAAAATLSRVAVPEMLERGYSKRFTAGVVSISGTLAIVIPPSIPLIIYGILTETSISKLLVAGMVPGLITAALYVVVIKIWTGIDPTIAPPTTTPMTFRERWEAIKHVWPFLLVVLLIFVALYSGAVTTTEASALGASIVIIIWLVLSRIRAAGLTSFNLKSLGQAFDRTLGSTVMILVLLIGAYLFSFYLTTTGASQAVATAVTSLNWPPVAILAVVILLFLVLGMFLSQLEIMILTLPIVFPLITGLGYDGIWFGIIVVKTIEIGLVSPPVGMNVFVVCSSSRGLKAVDGFVGALPFLAVEMVALLLFVAFPEIVLFVPRLMGP